MSNLDIPDGAWLVRGGKNDELTAAFERKGAITLAWPDIGDLSAIHSLEEFKARLLRQFAAESPEYIRERLQELFWFVRLIAVGDYVLTDDKLRDEIMIGKAATNVEYNVELFGSEYPYIRRVGWLKRVGRNQFAPETQRDLYSILPVDDIRSHRREIHKQITGEEINNNNYSQANTPLTDVDILKSMVHDMAHESEDFIWSITDAIFSALRFKRW